MSRTDNPLDHLLAEYAAARLSRREAMKRATALGLSASALAGLLATARPSTVGASLQEEPVVGGTLREGYDLDFSRMDPVGTSFQSASWSVVSSSAFT